jgi:hypothetical protein
MFLRPALVLFLAACYPILAMAQLMQPGGAPGYMPRFAVLLGKPVQTELKITPEQWKKIEAKIKELAPEGSSVRMPDYQAGKEGDQSRVTMRFRFKSDNNGAIDPKTLPMMPNLPDFKKIDEEVLKLLEPPQRDRLRQIVLQRTGLTALAQEDVAKEVELEPEQKEMIKHILEEQKKKTTEMLKQMIAERKMDQESLQAHTKKQREQAETDIGLLLTPVQQSKWEELQGPRFEKK